LGAGKVGISCFVRALLAPVSAEFALSIDGVDAVAFFTLRTGVDASAADLTFDAVADGALITSH